MLLLFMIYDSGFGSLILHVHLDQIKWPVNCFRLIMIMNVPEKSYTGALPISANDVVLTRSNHIYHHKKAIIKHYYCTVIIMN